MRMLNESEMSVTAGGTSPPPNPWCRPEVEPPEHDLYLIRMLLWEPEICDDSSHENHCI